MSEKSQCPVEEEGKKVLDRMLIHRPRFPVNIERALTNTQRIRIYPGKLKFILVKASSAPGQRKPNHIHVSYC